MVLESVRILGNKYHSDLESSASSSLQDFLSIAKVKKIRIVLGIVIKDASYFGITIEEKIDEKIEKYLYSAGSANGPDKTPASIITIPERTFQNKILRWFDRFAASDTGLITIREILMSNKDVIIADMKKQINDLEDMKMLDKQLHGFISSAEDYTKEQNTEKRKVPLRYENYLMLYEKDLLGEMVEGEVNINLLFLFVSLKGGGKYMDIEKYIEDVPITWIARILDVYNKLVLGNQCFNEASLKKIFGEKWKQGRLKDKKYEMYLASVVKVFFPVDSLDMKFLDVITKILTGSNIHSRILFKAFMRSIRPLIYKNWNQAKMVTLKSLVRFMTMLKLQLISDIDPTNIDRRISVDLSSAQDSRSGINNNDDVRNDAFFDEILDTNQKKAVFLEGLLVGKLLSIQYAVRKSTPFVVIHLKEMNEAGRLFSDYS